MEKYIELSKQENMILNKKIYTFLQMTIDQILRLVEDTFNKYLLTEDEHEISIVRVGTYNETQAYAIKEIDIDKILHKYNQNKSKIYKCLDKDRL